jgi:transcriptional regulator with XRE-family HTH domain
MSSSTFGPRLAQLRRRRGLSQQQLAHLLCAATGTSSLTRNEISRWERGQRQPAQAWMGWLALVLHVPSEQLSPGRPRVARHPDAAARRWTYLRDKLAVARPGVLSISAVD